MIASALWFNIKEIELYLHEMPDTYGPHEAEIRDLIRHMRRVQVHLDRHAESQHLPRPIHFPVLVDFKGPKD